MTINSTTNDHVNVTCGTATLEQWVSPQTAEKRSCRDCKVGECGDLMELVNLLRLLYEWCCTGVDCFIYKYLRWTARLCVLLGRLFHNNGILVNLLILVTLLDVALDVIRFRLRTVGWPPAVRQANKERKPRRSNGNREAYLNARHIRPDNTHNIARRKLVAQFRSSSSHDRQRVDIWCVFRQVLDQRVDKRGLCSRDEHRSTNILKDYVVSILCKV